MAACRDALCRGAVRVRHERELRPDSRCVANLRETIERQIGQHTDRHSAREIDIVAEGSGDDHLFDLVFAQPGIFEQHLNPGLNRAFGELHRADVALVEDDGCSLRLAFVREHEFRLPVLKAYSRVYFLHASRRGDDAGQIQLRCRIEHSRSTNSNGRSIPNRPNLYSVAGNLHRFDRSGRRAHPTTNVSAFQRRPRGTRDAQKPTLVDQRYLGVRADVERHDRLLFMVAADRKQHRSVVSAHKPRDIGQRVDVGPRHGLDPDIARLHVRRTRTRCHERHCAEIFDGKLQE